MVKTVFWLVLTITVFSVGLATVFTLQRVAEAVVEMRAEVHGTSQNLNADLIQLGLTLDQVRQASLEERSYWQKTAKESAATVRAVRQLVDRTDRSLNDQLVPQASTSLGNLDEQVGRLGPAVEELAKLERDADRQVNQPAIDATLGHVEETTAHLAETTKHLDAASADAEKYVHRITKPVSTAKQVGLAIANFFGHVLGGWL